MTSVRRIQLTTECFFMTPKVLVLGSTLYILILLVGVECLRKSFQLPGPDARATGYNSDDTRKLENLLDEKLSPMQQQLSKIAQLLNGDDGPPEPKAMHFTQKQTQGSFAPDITDSSAEHAEPQQNILNKEPESSFPQMSWPYNGMGNGMPLMMDVHTHSPAQNNVALPQRMDMAGFTNFLQFPPVARETGFAPQGQDPRMLYRAGQLGDNSLRASSGVVTQYANGGGFLTAPMQGVPDGTHLALYPTMMAAGAPQPVQPYLPEAQVPTSLTHLYNGALPSGQYAMGQPANFNVQQPLVAFAPPMRAASL